MLVRPFIALFLLALVACVPGVAGVHGASEPVTDPPIVAVTARLTPAAVVPRPVTSARASGAFSARLRADGRLTWSLTYSSLSSRVLAAHVHIAEAGKRGWIAISLCPPRPCRPNMLGTWRRSQENAIWKALVKGRAYVDVHTRRNPKGEIRGQTEAVQTAG